jgi:hypothetical protein
MISRYIMSMCEDGIRKPTKTVKKWGGGKTGKRKGNSGVYLIKEVPW